MSSSHVVSQHRVLRISCELSSADNEIKNVGSPCSGLKKKCGHERLPSNLLKCKMDPQKNVGGTIPTYYMQSCMLEFLQVRTHRYIAMPSIPIEFCLILRLPGLPEEVSEIALEALAQAVADGAAELHVLQSCLELGFGILKP